MANTAYTYRVTAIDAVPNESGQSDVAGATTLAPAGVDVGAVFNLTLDAGAGLTAADSSGNGNQGTLVNGATWTAGTAFGAVSFDGSNDAIVVPASATINGVTTSVTVAAWVYRNGAQPSWVSVLSRQLGTGAGGAVLPGLRVESVSVGGEHGGGGVFEHDAGGRGAGGAVGAPGGDL